MDVIIIGAGGHAKVIADIVIKAGDKLLGFLDDNKTGEVIFGYKVIGKISDCINYKNTQFIIGIGNNSVRKIISDKYELNWYTAIHPSAVIGLNAVVDKGTVIMAKAVINPDATIGKHCIINTAAVIEHDNIIGDYVHISPNATLCGTVKVGAFTHIGASVTVKNNTTICGNSVIGAGAVVVNDIIKEGTYVGVPAKLMKNE